MQPDGRSALLAVLTVAVLLAGCSDGDSDRSAADRRPALATQVGESEGLVRILTRPGYAERGGNDVDVDWVSDFEEETRCTVEVTEFDSDDEVADSVADGGWDVVAAPREATSEMIDGRLVDPLNTALVPNFADVFDSLKARPWNSRDGQMFGIPGTWSESTADTWMVTEDARHPNCAYMWLDWIVSPDVNAQVAEWMDHAPSNRQSCDLTIDPDYCADRRAFDDAYVRETLEG